MSVSKVIKATFVAGGPLDGASRELKVGTIRVSLRTGAYELRGEIAKNGTAVFEWKPGGTA